MKKQNGGVKLITLIIIVLVLIAILFTIVMILKFGNKGKNIENDNNLSNNETNEIKADVTNYEGFTTAKVNTEISDFDLKFLRLENNSQNLIYSPLSIQYGLSMLKDGANGNTKTQIENLIGDKDLSKYKNIENILSLANGLFIRDSFSDIVKEDYTNLLKTKYNADLKLDSFASAKPINSWIENKTFNQIKDLLEDDDVTNPDAQMFLINALAIDMKWDSKFEEDDTYKETFNLQNGSTSEVDTMHQTTSSGSVSYFKNDSLTTLSMDYEKYEDVQLQCITLMPNNTELSSLIKDINPDLINKIANNLKSAEDTDAGIEISIPKFEYDYSLNFKEDLINLGMIDAFDGSLADFSNMAYKEKMLYNLYVGKAFHKAKIKFSENGTKAAAVTGYGMEFSTSIGDERKPIKIKFDKPFMYVIRDKQTHDVWFIGTVYNPA